ncbi:protein NRT1/ PTR FAMILY 5.10-like isoform X1 [Macadamia integrifolia]|uniref:protein NRT1/ PTR FAMILY 5.10-like isoform X1 n=1 Tax=Macadamia integrifolia TaxID=60698 RepID=UPI001C4FCB75|nr:protein NRT1/ PTR FAMILY 5.10-like isoform X1 [Macadamia integrifolia]XP_042506889.1 protein NRT1/ PTR FAMILY 5.10-like isoform X1 [Macadamia integrifolia]XP_042506895.1 protein NRT1/ PTR FAMILY 5.10-like isoform X1 [Macadamia integrifolia]XP_042506902.1 protein NRT1/ PTR FAMILY 5.10-like isoform X1 [Macadamia integrifolia]XP_042506909.1 protein NRT1/ PTR FAMILY 5.10-like isoform X1 [Macadamia integrifolia]
MAESATASSTSDASKPLLRETEMVEGVFDYKGRPVNRSYTGGWRSAACIIGVEIAERFAYCGISSNLITYLTGPLRQSTVTAAGNVNAWTGAASILPLFGAFVADAFLGRYRTILFASLLYILGLGLLTLLAMLPSFNPPNCQDNNSSSSCPPGLQIIIFFCSLYLVAFAQGGTKPCAQAFGADQFDARDPKECTSRSSFFNWGYCAFNAGSLVSLTILNYIQDNMNWGLGFGIPCVSMVFALVVFLLGTKTYRYNFKDDKGSPIMRITRVFFVAAKNWQATPSASIFEEEAGETHHSHGARQYRFLDKALITASDSPGGPKKNLMACSISEVEEAKAVVRLVPIWATCLVYAIVFVQSSTFFIKQGGTMDRSIGSGFQIPAASLQSFISLSIILFIPIFDRVIIPISRAFTRKPSGITMLQRIGTGMILSVMSMVVAALVEKVRLKISVNSGLADIPEATVPISVWWLVPQFVLFGVSDVFTMVGLQEFFYDQVPNGLQSVGLSLYLSIFGVGSFLSSFFISVIQTATSGSGGDGWFSNNLNRAHLDYFYWLLAGLSAVELIVYLYFARGYVYKRERTICDRRTP